jgi:hypothetical protein
MDVNQENVKETNQTDVGTVLGEAATNATSYLPSKASDAKLSPESRRSISFDLHSEIEDLQNVNTVNRKVRRNSSIIPFETCLDPLEQMEKAQELRDMEC